MKIFSASSHLFKGLAVAAVVVALLPAQSSAQKVITLQQAVDSTLKNNLQIKQALYSAALGEETLSQSKYALYPTLSGSSSYGVGFGRSINQADNTVVNTKSTRLSSDLSTNVTIFSGFQLLNQIRQNNLLLDADKTNVNKIKNDLLLQVVTAYLQVLYNVDLLKTSQEQFAVANETLKREQELLNVGNKTLADISQAKAQAATAENAVTTAQNALDISYLTLGQLMELPPNTSFQVQAPLYNGNDRVVTAIDASEVYRKALENFPDITLYALRTQAAKTGIDIARGNYYPRLSFGAGLGSGYYTPSFGNRSFIDQYRDNFGQNIGFNLQIPIFNGFQARSTVRRAKIAYQNAQLNEQIFKNTLNKTVYQAVVDLRAAESSYESSKNTFTAQKDAFNVIEQRYGVGLANSLDYSTARTNMNKAETDMILAKYNLLFRAKVIDYYLGKQITF